MRLAAALVALLVPAAALAEPVWLQCSGPDQRFKQGQTIQHALRVMFDEQNRSVAITDGTVQFSAESVDITPVRVTGSTPTSHIVIDRTSGTMTYLRFDGGRVNISLMKGDCRAAPAPARKF